MEKLNLTPNMKLLFHSIDSNLLSNIINNTHINFNVEDNILEILIDVKNPRHSDDITDIVHKLNKTLKNYYLTGCCFTPSYERTDQYKIKKTYYHKCEYFDQAYQAVKLILPTMTEIEFSKLHNNFTIMSDKKCNYLYKKEKRVSDNQYTLLTVYIADVDIVSNLSTWSLLFEAIDVLWK